MNTNSNNHEDDGNQNVRGLRKITYLEKYGVKHFPYRGKRRYTPLVYLSKDGGIFISNDVFGMTIRQFERMYKACLDRRKAHAQYILNLRYPDKTSDEYLEYLEDRTDCNKDYRSGKEYCTREGYLYDFLVNAIGCEKDIRKRQQLFIIKDRIYNAVMSEFTTISSGSLAEGLDLPGSDRDIMFVDKKVDVIQNEKKIKHTLQRTALVMETDNDHPGFRRLRLIERGDTKSYFVPYKCFERTKKGLYLSVTEFVSNINQQVADLQLSSHGPCLSDKYVDCAVCFRSRNLPHTAMQWASRHRHQWPPNSSIDKIIEYGCLLVPIGPRTMQDCNVLWRLSFSVAEKQLVYSFNYTQLLCYGLLKLTLKHIVEKINHTKGLLCSYFLKTALFWVSEEVDIDTFQLPNLFYCFTLCMKKLILWVNKCCCPNYFIPDHNMFQGKIRPDNNRILIKVLNNMTIDNIIGLIKRLGSKDKDTLFLLSIMSKSSFIMLDVLFYRICGMEAIDNFKILLFTKISIKSRSNPFITDVCKYYNAEKIQYAAQVLPSPNITMKTYNIHKLYHRLLQAGTTTDAVSGWLLYASFYYVTGQFDVTLRLTDYVLSSLPNMKITGCVNYDKKGINNYRNHVHSSMSLNEKMRIATIKSIEYLQNSSLIPEELQLEVKDQKLCLSPPVMSHCLRFLCFHHLGDITNRQQELSYLYLTVKERSYIRIMMLSFSITILGVCYEISGDKDTAYQCYDEALKCDGIKCLSAKVRKSQLES